MKAYDHTQSTAALVWTINHNLNSDAVALDVYVLIGVNLEKIIPQNVKQLSLDTVQITFSSTRDGVARVVA